ncbi:hypothetical protein [Salinarimonas ramus]|uniref:Uncharacterized protein n=1 Tax=Salinarimonas ramus TaxID=690164 RepID=A0A917QAS7_9HYPH|nr:hypothetical protein [Salinarimonas ramus]GGK39658.1 hypothetical protein GCM10011322_28490 [Salinarimonas ramus]
MPRVVALDEKVCALHRAFSQLRQRTDRTPEHLAADGLYEWVDELALEIMRTPAQSWRAAQCKAEVMRSWFAADAMGGACADPKAAAALEHFIDEFEALIAAHLPDDPARR